MLVVFFSLCISLLFPSSSLSLNQEGLYLQRVKLGLSDPTNSLSSWNNNNEEDDDTPCNWYGITCDSVTHRVISIDLSQSQVAGPFPTFFCRLPYLTTLNLYDNSINSSLPLDISTCQSLVHLNLSYNLLVGVIPETLSQLGNLKTLDLCANNLTGDFPLSFGEFKSLEYLDLADNLLNGKIPSSIGNISTLKTLHLPYNPFSPSRIPSELGNLTNLDRLWLTDCNLVGEIPDSLTRLTRLSNLDLAVNRLSGLIPSSITEMESIYQIELYNNSFSGELPVKWSNTTTLKRFDVSMNELTGTIPKELCELQLRSLNLFENRFEGSLPESIGFSNELYELKLFNNKLSGELPSQLGKNSELVTLDVSYNQFSGEIPEGLCSNGKLEDLILIYNSFSGKIPESLGKCSSLMRIRLKHNLLSGSVPQGLWGLPHMYLLELVENSFTGTISKSIAGAHNLSIFLVSRNQFSGSIPNEVGLLGNLVEFSGTGNKFTGPIPRSLVNLNQLGTLDLSENELSGGIPEGIQGWKNLNELNLANNQLSGEIPTEIGSLPVLNYLDLSENFFSGKIPFELQNLKLNLLNLSSNRLSGELPPLYAKESYKDSFMGNPGLCNDLVGLCPKMGGSKDQRALWILRSIFILAGLVFIVGIVWFYVRYWNFKKAKKRTPISKWKSFHKIGFTEFEVIDCMKEENLIGSGASGKVYKVVLNNGEAVAVKKLFGRRRKDDTSDGSQRDEFEVEVETLGKIRHKNIVRLWCSCNTGDCKLLVYEYMPNGSLGDLLHSSKAGLLDWPTRYKIALDAAEGLSYLHHDCVPPIVHRDVKSNNILLNEDFSARVADFGLAKVVEGVNERPESMSGIAGSCGYIAPEYAYTLRVNEKSDIYSFGVVLLELVTGRRPIDPEFGDKDLVKWVCTSLDQKGLDSVIDPKLDSTYNEEIYRVLEISLLCSSALPINRPSMRKVVKLLQEASSSSSTENSKCKSSKKDGQLSPYYSEDVSHDQILV